MVQDSEESDRDAVVLASGSFPVFVGDRVIGAINVASRHRGTISPWERKVLDTIGRQLGTLIMRAKSAEATRASLEEKQVLLKEVHHRAKNNLQIIASLLDLQASLTTDAATRQIFKACHERIRAMALIHEQLYGSANLARIDFLEYAHRLTGQIARSYQASTGRVAVSVGGRPLMRDLETALPLGMILNELVSNAFMHGYPDGRSGRIDVTITAASENVTLVVSDDGIGLPPEEARQHKSLGLRLVRALVEQLEGAAEFTSRRGLTVSIGLRG